MRCALHDQIDQLPEGHDAGRGVDAPEDLAAADIQGRQIGQRTVTHVLKFVAARLARAGASIGCVRARTCSALFSSAEST